MSAMLYGDDGQPIGRIDDIVRALSIEPEAQDHAWLDGLLHEVSATPTAPLWRRAWHIARHAIKRRFAPWQ